MLFFVIEPNGYPGDFDGEAYVTPPEDRSEAIDAVSAAAAKKSRLPLPDESGSIRRVSSMNAFVDMLVDEREAGVPVLKPAQSELWDALTAGTRMQAHVLRRDVTCTLPFDDPTVFQVWSPAPAGAPRDRARLTPVQAAMMSGGFQSLDDAYQAVLGMLFCGQPYAVVSWVSGTVWTQEVWVAS